MTHLDTIDRHLGAAICFVQCGNKLRALEELKDARDAVLLAFVRPPMPVYTASVPVSLKVPRLSDPTKIVDVTLVDKGDGIPGYDAKGKPYEVWTTWYRVVDEDLARHLKISDGHSELVDYIQTDACKLVDGITTRSAEMASAWREVDLDWAAVANQVRLSGDPLI